MCSQFFNLFPCILIIFISSRTMISMKINRRIENKGGNLSETFASFPTRRFSDLNVIQSTPECVCVRPELCKEIDHNDKISNGEGFLDIRFGPRTECKDYFEVCCFNLEEEDFSRPHSGPLGGCGFGLAMGYRITSDGTNVQFGELPWTVMVLQEKQTRSMFKCGGSLIHQQVVLTAAHCVASTDEDQTSWVIRAGEWNTRTEDELLPHQDRTVKEILVHPHYQSGSLRNDLALMILNDPPVALAENVNVICLPPMDLRMEDNVRCVASGWGQDAFKKGKHSSVLKKVELPLVSREDCMRSLRATRLGQFYHLDKSFMCAGGERNRDTCKGDGGSPLVCPVPGHPNRFVQLGIVSWGIGCGDSDTPGVYANVALYRDWIDDELEARGFETNSYKYEN